MENSSEPGYKDTDMPSDYGTKSPLGLGIEALKSALKSAKSIKVDGCAAAYGDDDGIPLVTSVDKHGFSTVIVLCNIFWMGVEGNKYTVKWWVSPEHYISGEAVIQVTTKDTKKDESKEIQQAVQPGGGEP